MQLLGPIILREGWRPSGPVDLLTFKPENLVITASGVTIIELINAISGSSSTSGRAVRSSLVKTCTKI